MGNDKKWKVGDRVTTTLDNKFMATILEVEHSEFDKTILYTVKWDHFDKPCTYCADSVNDLWEDVKLKAPRSDYTSQMIERDLGRLDQLVNILESKIGINPLDYYNGLPLDYDDAAANNISIPGPTNYIPFNLEIEFKKTGCNHQWVNYVGLMEAYDYCKICNKKKE